MKNIQMFYNTEIPSILILKFFYIHQIKRLIARETMKTEMTMWEPIVQEIRAVWTLFFICFKIGPNDLDIQI